MNNKQIVEIANQVFSDEISGLQSVLATIGDEFCRAVQLIFDCKGKIIVSGMGKSGHIGNKIAATLASTGTAAFFMHPAEALHGDLGMIESSDLLIAISYSGESDELSTIIPIVRRKQVQIIGITGNPNSTLAKLSSCLLSVKIDREACPLNLAPTTSTTATLVLGDALAVALLSLRNFQPEDFALSHPGGSLGRRLLTRVSDIMHSNERLPVVNLDATLKEAVVEISKKGLGLVAVVDVDMCLNGIITDGDLRRIMDSDADIRVLKAHQIMTKNPKTTSPDDLAVDALYLMEKYQITGMVVVDNNKKMVGAFNMHDLFKAKIV
ncbi:MAG: KpsF/GutQ family sugar-phosphate isomerase [Neisseriales bacterium]|nr:MAG: KpsF/GutQ family sugar-phosphate isomerase [Neisseriales bacterium]